MYVRTCIGVCVYVRTYVHDVVLWCGRDAHIIYTWRWWHARMGHVDVEGLWCWGWRLWERHQASVFDFRVYHVCVPFRHTLPTTLPPPHTHTLCLYTFCVRAATLSVSVFIKSLCVSLCVVYSSSTLHLILQYTGLCVCVSSSHGMTNSLRVPPLIPSKDSCGSLSVT